MPSPARVLIVDDSRIFRDVLAKALAGQEGITVAGSVFSGAKALDFLQATPADVVTLDVEMPGLGGLETLEGIKRYSATRPPQDEVGVIMVSAFTKRGADVTVRALQAGAFDFVTKPAGPSEADNLAVLRAELVDKIRLFVARRAARAAAARSAVPTAVPAPKARPLRERPVRAVAIAASTGGPAALATLLPELSARIDLPILVVQHMPAPFTRSLADGLTRPAGPVVVEATDGELLRPRTVYIAPGGKHLLLRRGAGEVRTALNEQPPENCFRPSADVLFRSAAAAFGGDVVAVVLTGMICGTPDGPAGLKPLKRAGGHVIVQDEATSVVWGMPGSVVQEGLADEVLPLNKIADAVAALVAGREGR
jgi:two-component system chemotaxis response regulator CheB